MNKENKIRNFDLLIAKSPELRKAFKDPGRQKVIFCTSYPDPQLAELFRTDDIQITVPYIPVIPRTHDLVEAELMIVRDFETESFTINNADPESFGINDDGEYTYKGKSITNGSSISSKWQAFTKKI